LLRSNCSLSALVDASQRYDPPRCAEATRRDIIQKLEDWVRHDHRHSPPSSIFWLYGGAGAGKSALAQTLAEKFKTNEDLAASFFFFKADVNRNDGDRLIPTLALQLVQSFQGLTPIVEEMILRNPDLFKKSRQTQMLELLVEPLIRLSLEETDGEPVHQILH
jgi:replication-associated recombination protein RarA